MDNYSLEIFQCKFFIRDSGIARTCKYNEGLTAKDNHEDPNVEFAVHIKSWIVHEPLYYGSIKHSDTAFMLILLGNWPSFRKKKGRFLWRN